MAQSSDAAADFTDENVFRILVATDNHLGYAEKNGVRGDDSFRSFEEVLRLAKEHCVDFVLLGGDLFHDNKPSRNSLVRCTSLLRKYCFGSDPVSVQFCSDPEINFPGEHRNVNYMDPFLGISLPIFSIHGNHDDPTGAVGPEQLSSMDLLHTTGLVNYFGKIHDSKKITLEPLLLRKGVSKIALYGLGYIRDERLYTTWVDEKAVHWKRPTDFEGAKADSWFNIFVLHQNRAQRGTTRSVTDSLLPPWLDFVIWGHEHECRIDLEGGVDGPVVTQPGSTVATSLIEGEAKEKCAGLLEVFKDQFKWTKLPLKTVRTFLMQDVILSEQLSLHPARMTEVEEFLRRTTEQVLRVAEARFDERGEDADERLRQPLIRLRVDYAGGFEMVSPHRFGQSFVGRIANSAEILLFHKRRAAPGQRKLPAGGSAGDSAPTRAQEQEDDVRVPDLINHFLQKQNGLGVLPVVGLNGAIDRFVSKAEPHAITEYVEAELSATQKQIQKEKAKVDKLEPNEIAAICDRLAKAADLAAAPTSNPRASDPQTNPSSPAMSDGGGAAETGPRTSKGPDSLGAGSDSSSVDEEHLAAAKSRGRGTRGRQREVARGRGRGRGKRKAVTSEDKLEPELSTHTEPRRRLNSRSGRSRQTTLSFASGSTRRHKQSGSDDNSGNNEATLMECEDQSRKATAAGFASRRPSRRRGNPGASLHSIYDVDDDNGDW